MSMSNLRILVLPRSLAKNRSLPRFVAHLVMLPPRYWPKDVTGSTPKLSMSGRLESSYIFAYVDSRPFQMSFTAAISPTHFRSRLRADDSTTHLPTGTRSGTRRVSLHSHLGLKYRALTVLVDLIDHMLVVDPERRYTVDECLQHPWLTQKTPGVADSTDGLVDGIGGLDMHRRGVVRERTLLSSINSVHLSHKLPPGPKSKTPVKVYAKNPSANPPAGPKEGRPDDHRAPNEFMEMGGKGDQQLFGDDAVSFYSASEATAAKGGKPKGKGKGKVNGR
jgi:serine/threonine protein kinase